MDLKDFKKVAHDKKHTIFHHPDGHELKVSHKRLPGKIVEGLGGLPVKHLALGGSVQSPLGGDEGPEALMPTPDAMGADMEHRPLDGSVSSAGQGISNFIPFSGMFSDSGPSAPTATPDPVNPVITPPDSGRTPAAAMPGYGDFLKNLQNAGSGYTKGIENEAKAQADLGKEHAKIHEAAINDEKDALNTVQTAFSKIDQMRSQEIEAYKNQEFHAKDLFSGKDTFGKIGTAIGLLLGGAGGGLMGTENPVLKFINAEIERDLETQKLESSKRHNVVSMLAQQFGDTATATKFLQGMKNEVVAHQLEQKTALMQDPILKAQAQQKASYFKFNAEQSYQAAKKMAANQAIANSAVANPAIKVRAVVPEHHQKDAYRELKEQENVNHLNEAAMDAFDKVAELQTAASRAGSPIQSPDKIHALWEPTMEKVTKDTAGRVTPISVELLSKLKPGLFNNADTTALKRERFWKLLNGERATPTLDAYGISVDKSKGEYKPLPKMPGYNKKATR